MQNILSELSQQILSSPILIVDDSEMNRLYLEKILRSRGFTQLLPVSSAEEALQSLAWFQPEMILLDIVMPSGIDGYDCCEAIRSQERYRDLPILIQTSITSPELRVKAFKKGATDFVSKPLYPDELCARIIVHLERLHSIRTLQIYKSRIEVELEAARRLQSSILPEAWELEEIKRRCGISIASYSQPSSEIGGDFWGLKNIFPHQTAVWLVDFSGHGVAAALNSFRLQAYLKEYSSVAARPGEYLAHMNDKLLHLLMRGQFATMFYGIVDTQTSQLFYACACIPPPIILRKETGKAGMIDGQGNPLGIGMHLYPTQSITFAMGDVLLLYSDALTETPNEAGKYITEEQIIGLLEQHRDKSPEDIKNALLNYFNQHAGDRVRDDLTLVVCVRTAAWDSQQ